MKIVIEITEHNKNVIERYLDGSGLEELPQGIIEDVLLAIRYGKSAEQKNRCGDCKYLTKEKSSIGYACGNPNKAFRTDTAQYKYKHTPGCKLFEAKGEKT